MGGTLCALENDISDTLDSIGNTFNKLDYGLYKYYCHVNPNYFITPNLYYNNNKIGKIEIICFEHDIKENKIKINLQRISEKLSSILLENDNDCLYNKGKEEIFQILTNCYSNIFYYDDFNKNNGAESNVNNHNNCTSIKQCKSLRNIITALKYYDKVNA
eukprot:220369_1